MSAMQKSHIQTLKLKFWIADKDRQKSSKRLREIAESAWRAANWIASGQLLNDQLVRRVYARRKIDPMNNPEQVQQIEEEFKNFFETKRQATTERDIKEAFPNLPPCVTNPLNQIVVHSYNKEKSDMLRGNRSLRTYKKGMPFQVAKTSIEFFKDEEDRRLFKWKLSRGEFIRLGIIFGRDPANYRLTIDHIIEGKLDFSAPSIQYKDWQNIYLLLPVKYPRQELYLKPEQSVGVDLGMVVPAYVAVSQGVARKAIGNKEDFLRVRAQMQSRKRRLQRTLKAVEGGHGRSKKLKGLDRIKGKERNFARSYNHFISKEVVDFALKNLAGVIKMELPEGFGRAETHAFVLRNWSYFELQNMIEYKAKRKGIKVVKIDPYHTSQTCSACGHFEEGQRVDQATFVCKGCGEKMNTDFNAALNIARSDKVVTKKEQCEAYKKMKAEGSDRGADEMQKENREETIYTLNIEQGMYLKRG